ncbi:MAG: cyclase family protein [Ignavibacteriales bacterium]|nr:cyclase family protein [Ignavibacteriales bacterium]
MASRLVDLSHTVEHGMVTYEGLPAPAISDFMSREESRDRYSPGTEFQVGAITMVANTGTYVDAPFHRFADGKDLADLSLESLADLPGAVVRIPRTTKSINKDVLKDLDLHQKAVLFHTGWDRYWRTQQYFSGHPFLTRDASELLVNQKAAFVGIDSYNIDDTRDGSRPAHTLLLGAGIPVCEHLCHLDRLPDDGFRFFAVPVRVKKFGSFPVRAFAVVTEKR